MSRAFSGTVSPCFLFSHCRPSIAEYKAWSAFCSDWQFFCFSFCRWCQGCVRKKTCWWNPSGRQVLTIFAGGVSMSGLRGNFSSIYRPTLETKTCRFRTISNSSTQWTFRRRFSKFTIVAEKLIFKISYSIYFDYFSTCFSISRSTMETKTCQFRNISDSATRSTSCRKFFKIHLCCRELPTLYSK